MKKIMYKICLIFVGLVFFNLINKEYNKPSRNNE